MPATKKCAHPPCTCNVTPDGRYGDYCSPHCQEAKSMTELRCDCNHTGCAAA